MVETIMRTQSAILTLPFIKSENEELLTEWLNQMLFPLNPMEEEPKIGLSASIDAQKVTCSVNGNKDTLLAQFTQFIEASKLHESEIKVLQKSLKLIPEGTLSTWLQLSEGSQETGWTMNGLFPLAHAFAISPKSKHRDKLEAWYASFEADACVRVGRSVGGNRLTILHTELFGNNISEDVQLYLDLMEQLGISPLPTPLLEMIGEENPEYLELSFWLGSAGVIKAGLVVPEPSENLVRYLSIAYAEEAGDALAAFEGSIGAPNPSAIELSRMEKGVQVELVY
jgi:hypothetical protein